MSTQYFLCNFTKKEILLFRNIDSTKKRELSGSSVLSSIVSWYMMENILDYISMIPDQYAENQFNFPVNISEILSYKDVTEDIVKNLVKNNILEDNGNIYIDDLDKSLYIRNLKNIW